MIGYISGIVRQSWSQVVIVDAGGVGYEIQITASAFADLPPKGGSVEFYTHVAVHNDSHSIYGFREFGEREVFRILLAVNGIGPRSALSILSKMSVADLAASVTMENVEDFRRIPGIGVKTANRLILELRDKLDEFSELSAVGAIQPQPGDFIRDVIAALISLGYSSRESSQAAMGIRDEAESVEDGLRMALAKLGTAAS